MNGKLAPAAQVVHNQPDSSETEDGYYYGYRYAKRLNVSRYAIRDKARNLSTHPYTQGETRVKTTFRACVAKVQELLQDDYYQYAIELAFKQQRKYIRMYNYAVAMLVLHGGHIPPEWQI